MKRYTEHYDSLPNSIKNVISFLVQETHPEKLILFGSRARGDHRSNSDYDIAVVGRIDPLSWTKFITNLEEKNLTLYPIDLVQLNDLGDDYKSNISKEGKTLYG